VLKSWGLVSPDQPGEFLLSERDDVTAQLFAAFGELRGWELAVQEKKDRGDDTDE
jgi:hypothetical protein